MSVESAKYWCCALENLLCNAVCAIRYPRFFVNHSFSATVWEKIYSRADKKARVSVVRVSLGAINWGSADEDL